MFKVVAAVAIAAAAVIGLQVSEPHLQHQPCGGWKTYIISPYTTPTPTPGCHLPSFGKFSNGDHYTVYPSGKFIVW